MNRFAVVIPYFGKFKPSAALYLESCNRNTDVDFLFFTDCDVPEGVLSDTNIQWHRTTLEEVRALAEEKLNLTVALERAYKLCDLKPFYGLIFQEYLRGYEYWGFGDMDVIYGRIVPCLEKMNYCAYDKINWMGHLCFVRNTDQCNRIVFTKVDGTANADEVLSNGENLGFDERDYNSKCVKNGMKIHTGHWAADIDIFYWRMRCADKKTFHWLLNTPEIKYAPKNYAKQMFVVIEGVTYRVYLKHRKVSLEEFAYVHFRKEVPIKLSHTNMDTYVITRDGFEEVTGGKEAFEDYGTVKSMIKRFNNQENPYQEMRCFIVQWVRKITGKRGW